MKKFLKVLAFLGFWFFGKIAGTSQAKVVNKIYIVDSSLRIKKIHINKKKEKCLKNTIFDRQNRVFCIFCLVIKNVSANGFEIASCVFGYFLTF